MGRVVREWKLEVLIGGLADRHYGNKLKFRLFRRLKSAFRLPVGTAKIEKLLKNRGWRRYRKRVKLGKAEEMWGGKVGKRTFGGWKRWLKVRKRLKEREINALSRHMRNWKIGIHIEKLEKKVKYRENVNFLRDWQRNCWKRREIRGYFNAFCSICASERSNRIAKNVKINTFKAKLQFLYHIRVKTLIFKHLKEVYLAKLSAQVESLLRLEAYRQKIARKLLSEWHFYTFRTLFPVLIGRKVFKAARLLLKRKNSGSFIATQREKRAKNAHFREWQELVQSGQSRLIQAAEKFSFSWTGWKAISGLKRNSEQAKDSKIRCEAHKKRFSLLKTWQILYENYSFNRGRRYFQGFLRYRLSKYVNCWRNEATKSALFHREVLKSAQKLRACRGIGKWQRIARLVRLKNTKKADVCLRKSRLCRLFALLRLEIEGKKLQSLQQFRAKQVFQAWKEVIRAVKAYRSRAFTLSVPTRLKIKRKAWQIEELEAKKIREQAKKRGFKALSVWKTTTKRQIGLREVTKKQQFRVKSISFAMLFQHYYRAFRSHLSQNHCKKRLFGGYFYRWKSEIRLKKRLLSTISTILGRKAQLAVRKLQLHLLHSEVGQRYSQQAAKHWANKGQLQALRLLFVKAKKGFQVKFAREKLKNVRKPELLGKAVKGLRENVKYARIGKNIKNSNQNSMLLKCFSALNVHKNTEKAVKSLQNQCLKRISGESLRIWGKIAGILSALKGGRPEVAVYLVCNSLPTALKLVSAEFKSSKEKEKALNWLCNYAKRRKGNRKTLEKLRNREKLAKRREILQEWRLYIRRKSYKRLKSNEKCLFALIKLRKCMKIQQFVRFKRFQFLTGLFLAWKSGKTPPSLSPFLPFPASISLFRRPEKQQVLFAWHRKSSSQLNLRNWLKSKEKRLISAIWTIMQRVKAKFTLERDRTFHLRKDLTLELKRLFKNQRLANLFRQRKLGLKAVKTWRIQTLSVNSERELRDTESVYLYCPKEQESLYRQFVPSPESLLDSQQVDLEAELSLLTAQLNGGSSTRIIRETALGSTAKRQVSRKVAEAETEALGVFTRYRHEMRSQPGQRGLREAEERHRRVVNIIQTQQLPKAVQEVWELGSTAKPPPHPWR